MKALEILKTQLKYTWELYEIGYKQLEDITLIKEAIQELEDLYTKDTLAELEEVILKYYLQRGYQVNVGNWAFNIIIDSDYKYKWIQVYFKANEDDYDRIFEAQEETTKEMFDKAFKHFSL